jgi:hypothetical protein
MIICPTHGRAGRVYVLEVLPDIPLCVAESQAPAYAAAHPDSELVVHPDSVVGIAPKRQWLVDRYENVMMFDDDVTTIVDMQVPAGEQQKIRDPQKIRDIVHRLFSMGEAMGAHVLPPGVADRQPLRHRRGQDVARDRRNGDAPHLVESR